MFSFNNNNICTQELSDRSTYFLNKRKLPVSYTVTLSNSNLRESNKPLKFLSLLLLFFTSYNLFNKIKISQLISSSGKKRKEIVHKTFLFNNYTLKFGIKTINSAIIWRMVHLFKLLNYALSKLLISSDERILNSSIYNIYKKIYLSNLVGRSNYSLKGNLNYFLTPINNNNYYSTLLTLSLMNEFKFLSYE